VAVVLIDSHDSVLLSFFIILCCFLESGLLNLASLNRDVVKNISRLPRSPWQAVERGGSVEVTWVAAFSLRVRYPIRPYASDTVRVPLRDPFTACGHDRVSAHRGLCSRPWRPFSRFFLGGSRTMCCAPTPVRLDRSRGSRDGKVLEAPSRRLAPCA
jgi:hypothetical protein